jgi:hypothetical protein
MRLKAQASGLIERQEKSAAASSSTSACNWRRSLGEGAQVGEQLAIHLGRELLARLSHQAPLPIDVCMSWHFVMTCHDRLGAGETGLVDGYRV